MKKTFGVIGLGKFGFHVAKTLTELGAEVIAVDREEEKVKDIAEIVTQTYVLDAMDEKSLKEAGLANIDVAVVSIGQNVEANIIVVMSLMELGVKNIVAKAVNPIHGRLLEKLGVTRVVYPERDMAIRVSHSLLIRNVLEEIPLTGKHSIFEVKAPQNTVGKALKDLHLPRNYNIIVLAIRRNNELLVNPSGEDFIQENDILLLLGENEKVVNFSNI
ncbi:MAG: TrkA family potassium uptake protein [bacterium]